MYVLIVICSEVAQQNYLIKMDLDGLVFLCENLILMSVFVCMSCVDIKWYHHDPDRHKTDTKTGFPWRNTVLANSILKR